MSVPGTPIGSGPFQHCEVASSSGFRANTPKWKILILRQVLRPLFPISSPQPLQRAKVALSCYHGSRPWTSVILLLAENMKRSFGCKRILAACVGVAIVVRPVRLLPLPVDPSHKSILFGSHIRQNLPKHSIICKNCFPTASTSGKRLAHAVTGSLRRGAEECSYCKVCNSRFESAIQQEWMLCRPYCLSLEWLYVMLLPITIVVGRAHSDPKGQRRRETGRGRWQVSSCGDVKTFAVLLLAWFLPQTSG